MEYLDIYDENKIYLGKELRDIVHKEGLWHNTVHCWLYDKEGNIYFQIRKDEGKFYTTASGHVNAGETIKESFGREIKEEIGINVDYEKAELVDVVVWQMDKVKSDGTIFKDRAFANVNVCEFTGSCNDFVFDINEVLGVVKVKSQEVLSLFKEENGCVEASIITTENGINIQTRRLVEFSEFLVNKHETAILKYGDVLNKIIDITSAKEDN